MKSAAVLLILVVCLGGCTSSRKGSREPRMFGYSEYSTAERLRDADPAIEKRAESLERQGLGAKEARQYAEIEYLKSSAGSPLSR